MTDKNDSGIMASRNEINSFTSHQVDTNLRAKVITMALYSRFAVIGLAFIFDLVIPNHDAGAFAWTPSSEGSVSSPTLIDRVISLLCDGLTVRYTIFVSNNINHINHSVKY